MKLTQKKLHQFKQKGQSRINTSKTAYQVKTQEFVERFEESLATSQEQSASNRWSSLRITIYSTAFSVYGKKERKNADWFEANITELEPVINGKRDPTPKNLQALRIGRSKAQQTARRCANNYWLQLSESIQQASDTGNIRGMYEGIKQAT